MSDLTVRESELVALAAALGSNCVPCIEHHIPQARKAGLTDQEIHAAIQQADKVRQVPARKVLEAALNLLPRPETASADRTVDTMATMMSTMMSSCAPLAAAGAGDCSESAKQSQTPAPENGRGCC